MTEQAAAGRAHGPMLEIRNLRKYFPVHGGLLNRRIADVQAVDDVSFQVRRGETLGIVGESGCGKSTLARLVMWLIGPDAGTVEFDGRAVGHGGRGGSGTGPSIPVREMRRQVQMVFQDSYSSLNPRMPVEGTVGFGPVMHGVSRSAARRRARDLLHRVGLDPTIFGPRYSHELSGGQRQRVNIARALAIEPRVIILDEAVSALDKSVEAQVLNLLADLKSEFNLTYMFISHDLNVVQYVSDRVMVMYLGKIVEIGDVDDLYSRPLHPYTKALLAAMPTLDPDNRTQEAPLSGDPPNPINPPPGCRFRDRCRFAEQVCRDEEPPLTAVEAGDRRLVACHMAHYGSGHSAAGS